MDESHIWKYRAKPIRVIDGDTIILDIDLGFHTRLEEPVRLYGINTPELDGSDRNKALDAKNYTEAWIGRNETLYIQTYLVRERDKYGRVLAKVYREGDETTLNDQLLRAGLAKIYP